MASLTHVCMWSDNGWKRITAKEAAKMHPGGTVSAHSGLFMCELCGQYVILTDGDIKTRYFKHSAYEKSKDCPERTFASGYEPSYNPQEHNLPIRITGVSNSSFRFELGLIRVPADLLSKELIIKIKPKSLFDETYVFNAERLNYNSITYLPIGEKPFEKYTLSLQNGSKRLYEFWPAEIKGIAPEGTLFEVSSGKKLPYDADVEINKEYYLLTRGCIYRNTYADISIKEVVKKRSNYETWTLYVVSAHSFNEYAARFYLRFHCRLTDHSISMQPVWPLFVEGNYIIKHNRNYTYMLVEGNTEPLKTFPVATVHQLGSSAVQTKISEVKCTNRQQLISVGRARVLKYTYFWKEPLDKVAHPPEILVTDLAGNNVSAGKADTLPPQKSLLFQMEYDGEIVIYNHDKVVSKHKASADKCVEIGGLSYNFRVQAFVGLDIVWQIDFIKRHHKVENDEAEILNQMTNVSGSTIPAPHSLHNILLGMKQYPSVCQWIQGCIKSGTICEQSYRKLQTIYINTIMKK